MSEEVALIGWKAIGCVFGVSTRTIQKRREVLISCGAIFYMNHGRPPKRQVMAFPSLLQRYTIIKSKEVGRGRPI
jgi:hypothetical protein